MFKNLFQPFRDWFRPKPAPELESSCSAPDAGPWRVDEWHNTNQLVLQSDAQPNQVALAIMGNFESNEQRLAYANSIATWLNDQVAECTTVVIRGSKSEQMDMDNMPWEVDEGSRLPRHAAAQRRMGLGEARPPQRAQAVRDEPLMESAPAAPPAPAAGPARAVGVEAKPFGVFGCHCELAPGQAPDLCAIDQGRRDDCCLAMDGRERNSCEYWQPIEIRRAS